MPLCWWFSRSLEPDKETEERVAFVPSFVPDSHKANVGVAQQDRAALSHPPVLVSLPAASLNPAPRGSHAATLQSRWDATETGIKSRWKEM